MAGFSTASPGRQVAEDDRELPDGSLRSGAASGRQGALDLRPITRARSAGRPGGGRAAPQEPTVRARAISASPRPECGARPAAPRDRRAGWPGGRGVDGDADQPGLGADVLSSWRTRSKTRRSAATSRTRSGRPGTRARTSKSNSASRRREGEVALQLEPDHPPEIGPGHVGQVDGLDHHHAAGQADVDRGGA